MVARTLPTRISIAMLVAAICAQSAPGHRPGPGHGPGLGPLQSAAPRANAAPALRPGVEADWAVAGWHVAHGGFSGLRDVASARVVRTAAGGAETIEGVTWAVDPHRVGGGATAERDLTAMVRIDDGLARVTGFVDGVLLQALSIADGADEVGFAVGIDGAMARLAGERWVRITSPTEASLVAVALFSPGAGWAVGSRSTILHWDGTRWAIEDAPPGIGSAADITGVAAVSAERAWAVTFDGLILERDAAGWRLVEGAPRTPGLSSIAFQGTERGYAAGDGVLEYSGGDWRALSLPDGSYSDVVFAGAAAYVVRDGEVFRLEGTRLDVVGGEGLSTPLEERRIARLVALAPDRTDVLAVARPGVVVRISGLAAHPSWPPVTGASSLAVTSDNFGWIGGTVSTAGIVGAGNDGAWRRMDIAEPGVTITDIDAPLDGVAWAAGYIRSDVDGVATFIDKAWRWDGEGWADADPPPGVRFDGISALSRDEAFSARGNGIVRWDGAEWQALEGAAAPEGAEFGDVHMLAGGPDPEAWDGWFGGVGAVHRLRAGSWTTYPLRIEGVVTRLVMSSESEGWALAGGEVFRFDGAAWSATEPPIDSRSEVLDIDSSGANDAWLLTDFDGLLHWDGARWRRQGIGPLADQATFHRVRALRPDPDPSSPAVDIWLLGSPFTLARYRLVVPVARLMLPWVDIGRR